MIAGHLQEKKGYYYAVLSYKDAQGKRKTKWIATGLSVRGNKKKAEAFLAEQRRTFTPEMLGKGGELFADYLLRWLKIAKSTTDHLRLVQRTNSQPHSSVVSAETHNAESVDCRRHSGVLCRPAQAREA